MHHRAVVKLGRNDYLGYNIQCSCGTGGDFGSKEEAMNWMTANHFRFLQGINTAEFVDETPHVMAAGAPLPDEPEPVPGPVEPPSPEEPEEEAEDKPKKRRSAR